MNRRHMLALLGGSALSACDLLSTAGKEKLKGERYSVLALERRIEPDPALAQLEVRLPRPMANADWPQPGGYPNHAMQHLALGDNPARAWRASVGEGNARRARIITPPVVAGGRVFAMDARARVRAFDVQSGSRAWEFDAAPTDARGGAFGGGVCFAEDQIFVGSGFGQVVALDAGNGKEVWRANVGGPIRGAPTAADGRVFVITNDNQLEALATDDGRRLWFHNGTPETASLYGGASPAVEGDVVVVPYSSAEIFALRVENGRPLWSDVLGATRRIDPLATLGDIRGLPVIDRGRVFAISHSGRLVAIELRSGERAWEQEIGGTETPWVAGDFVFVLTSEAELFCFTRADGRVRWAVELPRYERPDKKKDAIEWTGPILAGDRLIVAGSTGEALSISPYTGQALGSISLPDGVFIAPVVAGETLYLLTDEAELIAMR
jgi:outer membrane protein assembly factor BamB